MDPQQESAVTAAVFALPALPAQSVYPATSVTTIFPPVVAAIHAPN
jgi:hypothetical protein